MTEKPAFEVRAEGRVYKIYASGKVDGFANAAIVVNRIPAIVASALSKKGQRT